MDQFTHILQGYLLAPCQLSNPECKGKLDRTHTKRRKYTSTPTLTFTPGVSPDNAPKPLI